MSARPTRGRGGRRVRRTLADINVTPFVDVMLVLLIVFMVTAPLLTAGIAVELPKTEARSLQSDKDPLSVSIQADGTVFLQETPVSLEELSPQMKAIAAAGYEQRIFIRAAGTANYETVARVMAILSEAGYKNLGLVTEPLAK
jgi:biopolymer transport protein TolR